MTLYISSKTKMGLCSCLLSALMVHMIQMITMGINMGQCAIKSKLQTALNEKCANKEN
jgi:hypothetical protein